MPSWVLTWPKPPFTDNTAEPLEGRHAMNIPLPVIQRASSDKHSRVRNSIEALTSTWARAMGGDRVPAPSLDPPAQSQSSSDMELGEIAAQVEAVVVDHVVLDKPWSEDAAGRQSGDGDDATISEYSMRSTDDIPGLLVQPSVACGGKRHCLSIWRLVSVYTMAFFSSRFSDPKIESDYQNEVWQEAKPLSFWASMFFIANWALGTAFIQDPVVLTDRIFYYCVSHLNCADRQDPIYDLYLSSLQL
ncbi:hypothetical protein DXG03_007521 [Asterophora parasitica]|uniref:Uncharacterized protein n=1 Tax=Asterophora parasitica TaxID=117018 RepID=A0A9P7KDI4_9AGAR|nr:hypothetical protein DXG03_007521 [Asterophora parasitica]